MDVVDKRTRGRWSALENLTSATWTGSAALGGLLLERFGFQQLYLVTALIYVASLVLLLPIIPLTRGERVDDGVPEGDEAPTASDDADRPPAVREAPANV